MIYYIIFCCLCLSTVVGMCYKCIQKPLLFFWILFFGILSGIRDDVGLDYDSYVMIYDMAPTWNDLFSSPLYIEPGYLFLCSTIKTLGGNTIILFSVTSLITSLIFYKAANRIVPGYELLAFFVFYAFHLLAFEFNVIRHGMMISLSWLGFTYIPQKNFRKFIICIILASTIHLVGIFMIPMYWILQSPISAKKSMIAILLSFLIGRLPMYTILAQIVSGWSVYGDKYIYYTTQYVHNESLRLSIGVISYIIILFYFIAHKRKNTNPFFNLLANSLLIAICAFFILSQNNVFATRVMSIFNMSIIFIIPLLMIISIPNQSSKFLFYTIVTLYCFLLLTANLRPNIEIGKSQYLPFKVVKIR